MNEKLEMEMKFSDLNENSNVSSKKEKMTAGRTK